MLKKALVSSLFSFLIVFILFSGFHANLFANDTKSIEKEISKLHVLSTESLRKAVEVSCSARLANIEKLENQLSKWGFSAAQVKNPIRMLSNSELEYIVRKSENVNENLFGGSDTGKTVGLIAMSSVIAFIIIWEVAGLSAGAEIWN